MNFKVDNTINTFEKFEEVNNLIPFTEESYIWDSIDIEEKFTEEECRQLCYCTVVDDEEGGLWLLPGWHFVNRVGYIISNKPIKICEQGVQI